MSPMMMPEDNSAQNEALDELAKFARGKMDGEMRARSGMDKPESEPVPGVENEGEECDGADMGEAGEDGMCDKCGKKVAQKEGEGGADPEMLRAVLESMQAGGKE